MTTEPSSQALLINGCFTVSPRGVQKSLCFIYKLHIDDEYMPKFMDHLQTSNNSLTIKWNTNAGNDEENLMEYQTMVSLPKKEGRNFVLKGLLQRKLQKKWPIRRMDNQGGLFNETKQNGSYLGGLVPPHRPPPCPVGE